MSKKYKINDIERENPFDILEHTNLINNNGEFNKDIKLVANVNKVQVTLGDFVNDGVKFLVNETKSKDDEKVTFNLSRNYAQIGTSGDCAQIGVKGNDCIAFACGYKSIIKAKNGTWIALAEYKKNEEGKIFPIFAKSAQIGNEEYTDHKRKILKEKYYYTLVQKEFVPVIVVDGDIMVVLSEKKRNNLILYKTQYLNAFIDNKTDKQYVVSNGEFFAHGETLEQAINDLTFKILQQKDTQDHIKRVCEQGYMMATDYRLITGACWYGTNKWLEENGYTWEDKKTIEEVIELTKGYYGCERLKESFEKYVDTKKDN